MKNYGNLKKFLAATLSVAACTGAFAAAGCSGGQSGEAFGATHGGGYVSRVTITVNGDKVTALTLQETCVPTYVKYDTATSTESAEDASSKLKSGASADDIVVVSTSKTANDVTTYTATAYYKTVSYGSVTLTFDATTGDYMSGETPFLTLIKDDAQAKAYFEAVENNAVSVTVNGQGVTNIMNSASLSKDENGYWTRQDKNGDSYSRWKLNRDATVSYVLANGVKKLESLEKSSDAKPDLKEDKEVNPWTDGIVVTGATWTDLNPAASDGYYSYAQLILAAADNAKTK